MRAAEGWRCHPERSEGPAFRSPQVITGRSYRCERDQGAPTRQFYGVGSRGRLFRLPRGFDQDDKLAALRARGPSTNLANHDGAGFDATITIFPVRSVGAAETGFGAG